MTFKLFDTEFTVASLIDASRNSDEVKRLIDTLKRSDPTYLVHEPLEEDIVSSNDNWSCHIAEKSGISFEFSNNQLFCISLKYPPGQTESQLITHTNEDIVCAIVSFNEQPDELAYGSKRILTDGHLVPDRYSPIIQALLNQLLS